MCWDLKNKEKLKTDGKVNGERYTKFATLIPIVNQKSGANLVSGSCFFQDDF